jgi:uncharacterized Zn-finger protein
MWTPMSDMTAVAATDEDLGVFAHLTNATSSSTTTPAVAPMPYTSSYNYNAIDSQQFGNSLDLFYQNQQQQLQQQDSSHFPMVAPLASPPTVDLSDAVSRMNMEDQHYQGHRQRFSLSSALSLEIQPCISITEPTPIHHMPSLGLVDQFIAQHSAELSQNQLQYQQQQQQQQQQEQDSFSQLMDPNSFLDDLLIAQSGNSDWLSWTPARGASPVSVNSNSFDDRSSLYSTSPEPNSLYYNMMMASEEILGSSPALGSSYPSSSLADFDSNNNTLTVKKANRSRRVSEPPKPSNSIIQEQQTSNTASTDRPIRRSNSDRRSRSNSNTSIMMSSSTPGNHLCLHPGCGKSFARLYNLTSHQKIHSNDRPYACSQCGRKFARQHDRNRHEKLHWGIKPYACMHCKKPFARMDALNRHLRVENGCSSHLNSNSNSNNIEQTL